MKNLVKVLQMLLVAKMEGYKPPRGRYGFQHYGQKMFLNRKIRSMWYFLLHEEKSIAGCEIVFVINRFKTIPVSVEDFPNSIRFKCFWRSTVRGRWKEVCLKPQSPGKLPEGVDVQEVELKLEKALAERT